MHRSDRYRYLSNHREEAIDQAQALALMRVRLYPSFLCDVWQSFLVLVGLETGEWWCFGRYHVFVSLQGTFPTLLRQRNQRTNGMAV